MVWEEVSRCFCCSDDVACRLENSYPYSYRKDSSQVDYISENEGRMLRWTEMVGTMVLCLVGSHNKDKMLPFLKR